MAEMIKPIETVYNGYRFRSRLEARWAVLFDAAKIQYEYEPEGMEDEIFGKRYLPDFYLPEYDAFVEIKAKRPGALQEIIKAVDVCCYAKRQTLILLSNIPSCEDGSCWYFPTFYYHPLKRAVFVAHGNLYPSDCGGASFRWDIYLCYQNETCFPYKYSKSFDYDVYLNPINDNDLLYQDDFRWGNRFDDGIMDAIYLKARQARFEHGECG